MLPARMKIERILCPTDYSEFSERALLRAVRIARWFGARITAVHVIPPTPFLVPVDAGAPYVGRAGDRFGVQRQQLESLERFVLPYSGEGVPIDTRVLEGNPSRLIPEAARELRAGLVVMGTHGRGGFEHLVLGSVTEKVLRRSTCPVLTVGRAALSPPDGHFFRRIVCALDLTEASSRTIDVALSLAEESMARVTLVHVLEGMPRQAGPPFYRTLPEILRLRRKLFEEAEDRLHSCVPTAARDHSWSVSDRVEEGTPWRMVLQVAEETRAELIVMGAHSRGALGRAFFGSTANHIVRQAPCPVLVVRETSIGQPAHEEASAAALSTNGVLSF